MEPSFRQINRKTSIWIIFVTILLLVFLYVLSLFMNDDILFEETLTINSDQIDKIMISDLRKTGQYKTTTDPEKIEQFLRYFGQVTYTRLSGDQTAFMPTRAAIIYLYEGEKFNYIVPYETEAMIAYKVYKINDGQIDNQFLVEYYKSLD